MKLIFCRGGGGGICLNIHRFKGRDVARIDPSSEEKKKKRGKNDIGRKPNKCDWGGGEEKSPGL